MLTEATASGVMLLLTAGGDGSVVEVAVTSSGREQPVLTRDVRAARDRRGLLSGDIARESGVDIETVVSVLGDGPPPAGPDDAERLRAWVTAASPGVHLTDPIR